MKNIKTSLRTLISATSIMAFVGGWALFAHSQKPTSFAALTQSSPVQSVQVPTLAPIPTLEPFNNAPRQLQSAPSSSNNSFVFSQPMLRTRGS